MFLPCTSSCCPIHATSCFHLDVCKGGIKRKGGELQNVYKVGNYWTRIEGYQERGVCPLCHEVEDMAHILMKCLARTRETAWWLVNELWTRRHNAALLNTLRGILGCGLAEFSREGKLDKGKNRLYRILVLETA